MFKAATHLRDQHLNFTRVRVEAKVKLADVRDIPDNAIKATAAAKEEQAYFFQDGVNPDLVFVNFLLDSEGANANWDYMPRERLVRSYGTCRFKPFNMEHSGGEGKNGSMVGMDKESLSLTNTIYGVMTHAALADANGRVLTSKEIREIDLSDNLHRKQSEKLTVVAWAAMYNFLFPETVMEMVEHVEAGNMRVSMERWMDSYDFMAYDGQEYRSVAAAVLNADGEPETPKSDAELSWEQHLHINGKPVFRRALAHVYGGAASTPKPANALARFIGHSDVPTQVIASANDPVLAHLLQRHTELHESFDRASAEEKTRMIVEHRKVTAAIAAYTGQEVQDG